MVYTAPLKITDIMFGVGEKIISEAAGDTLRWQLAETYSGQGSTLRQHLLVKPNAPNLENTIIVTTNQRVYHLVLKSTRDNVYMVSVKWNYPTNMVSFKSPKPSIDSASVNNNSNQASLNFDVKSLNFNYRFGLVKGNKPSWFPTRVFSSARQTFIEFPSSFNSSNLPLLFVENNMEPTKPW